MLLYSKYITPSSDICMCIWVKEAIQKPSKMLTNDSDTCHNIMHLIYPPTTEKLLYVQLMYKKRTVYSSQNHVYGTICSLFTLGYF